MLEHPGKERQWIFVDSFVRLYPGRPALGFSFEYVKWDGARQENITQKTKKVSAVGFSLAWRDLARAGWRIVRKGGSVRRASNSGRV